MNVSGGIRGGRCCCFFFSISRLVTVSLIEAQLLFFYPSLLSIVTSCLVLSCHVAHRLQTDTRYDSNMSSVKRS